MVKYPWWKRSDRCRAEVRQSLGRLCWGKVLPIVIGTLVSLLTFGGLACLPDSMDPAAESPPPAANQVDQLPSDPATPADSSRPQAVEQERTDNVSDYFEPAHPRVRDAAVFAVQETPAEIEANAAIWKIWKINQWVANNISYVSDPRGHNYYAFAHETLQVRGGDCDDFAILLASMYEAVGLDAAIATIDTDDDLILDHMTCLVYYQGDGEAFIEEETAILQSVGLPPQVRVIYFDPVGSKILPQKYTTGIWIVADPTMAMKPDKIGYVIHKPYKATSVIDVGD
jgi:hypothetical protein